MCANFGWFVGWSVWLVPTTAAQLSRFLTAGWQLLVMTNFLSLQAVRSLRRAGCEHTDTGGHTSCPTLPHNSQPLHPTSNGAVNRKFARVEILFLLNHRKYWVQLRGGAVQSVLIPPQLSSPRPALACNEDLIFNLLADKTWKRCGGRDAKKQVSCCALGMKTSSIALSY